MNSTLSSGHCITLTESKQYAHMYMAPSPTFPRAVRVFFACAGDFTPVSTPARKLDASTRCPIIAKSHLCAFSNVSLSQSESGKSPAAPSPSKDVGAGGGTFGEGNSRMAVAFRAASGCSPMERKNSAFNMDAVVDCNRFGGANNSSAASCHRLSSLGRG